MTSLGILIYYVCNLELCNRFVYRSFSRGNQTLELYEAGIELSLLYFSIECFYRGITWIIGREEYS
jgi:hypothetical protein